MSEASAAGSYQEPVKSAMALDKSRILGCLGHVALVHSDRRPILQSQSSIAACVGQRRLRYGFVAQFCSYAAVK